MNLLRGISLGYAAIVAGVIVVAGCSGGGGGTAPSGASSAGNPTPAPSSSGGKTTATAVLTFPYGKHAGIQRNYVSPNSTSVSITVNLVNGQPPPVWVSPNPVVTSLNFALPSSPPTGQNCTVSNGIATCTIAGIPAPPGNVDYTIYTTAVVNKATTILDYNEEVIQVAQGVNNQVAITLEGVVKSASVAAPQPFVPGASSQQQLTLSAYDASGALITGSKPFNSPFKLQVNDFYGSNPGLAPYTFFLKVNGLPTNGSKQVQVNSPEDVIELTYGGIAMSDFMIASSGSGRAGTWNSDSAIHLNLNPIVIPGTYVDDAANGGQPSDPNYNQTTLPLTLGGPAASIALSEVGRTTPSQYSVCNGGNKNQTLTCIAINEDLSSFGPQCNAAPHPIASFFPGPPNGQTLGYTYTVTPTAVGLCLAQFVDALTPGHNGPGGPSPGNPLVNGEIWVKVQQ